MPRAAKVYVRWVEAVCRRVGRLAMYLIFAMMGVLLYSSITKTFFIPPLWTLEMAQFAMAAYYRWLSRFGRAPRSDSTLLAVVELAAGAPERERLIIQSNWAHLMIELNGASLAESLVVRYPLEPDGHLLLGNAEMRAGRYEVAVAHLARAIELKHDWIMAYILRARCLVHLQRYEEAKQLLVEGRQHSLGQGHEGPVEEIDELLSDLPD